MIDKEEIFFKKYYYIFDFEDDNENSEKSKNEPYYFERIFEIIKKLL